MSDGTAAPGSPAVQQLPGGPATPFALRMNSLWARGSRTPKAGTLAVYVVALSRLWRLLSAPGTAALLAYCVAAGAHLAWGGRSKVLTSSFVRWQEAPAALLRLAAFALSISLPGSSPLDDSAGSSSCGVGDGSSSGSGGASTHGGTLSATLDVAAHFALVLFVSGTVAMLHHAFVWRMRLGLSATAQAAMLALAVQYNPRICSAAAFVSSPAARSSTSALYRALSTAGALVPLHLSVGVRPDATAECLAVVTWSQVGLGFLAPLLWEAFATARRFAQHEQERQAAGLPPESGAHAAVLRWCWMLSFEGCGVQIAMLSWLLLSVSFDWVAFFSAPPGLRM